MTSYATAEQLASWIAEADPVADAPQLALAVEAASRAIDEATGRWFGLVPTPQARRYTAEFDRHGGFWFVDIDDVQTTEGLVVESHGTPITAYSLAPVNVTDRPYERIEFGVTVNGERHGVTVTARWGWTTVPAAITLATLTQAAKFFARRDSPAGVLASKRVDDVSYGWRATDLDADVATAVAPYRKVWGAV